MTEKLYLIDSYLTDYDSKILEIIEYEEYFDVIFDKTPFFPGGGGQPSDKGEVGEFCVIDSYEKDGIVYHRINNKNFFYKVGDIVKLSVYNEIRIERMRAHTGEHIISGVANNKFNVNNVGFHMDENGIMTVDFDKHLDKADLQILELEANRSVMDNRKISVITYSQKEAEEIEFRSKIDFTDDIRIVDIAGIDKCACCAPHLKSTGEVGAIKILSSCSHRGGVRLTIICGVNAYNEFQKRYEQILNISALLCARYDDADIAVAELSENNKALKYELSSLRKENLYFISESIEKSDIICKFFSDLFIDDLRIINNNLIGKFSTASFLFTESEPSKYNYCIFSDKLNLNKLVKDMNLRFNGRGGGKGVMVQGSLFAQKSELIKFVEELQVEKYENA